MNRGSMATACSVVICSVVLLPAHSRELNPGEPRDPVLSSITGKLDELGIDTVEGQSLPDAGARPRLSDIRGFGKIPVYTWDKFYWGPWAWGFRDGVLGALIAIHKPWWKRLLPWMEGGAPPRIRDEVERCVAKELETDPQTCDFIRDWLNTPRESRVFVAFTRRDRDVAERVASVLRDEGYLVFVYLREGEGEPWAPSDLVGSLFADAGARYVLDTVDSRGSGGVAAEASCARLLETPPQTAVGRFYRDVQKRMRE